MPYLYRFDTLHKNFSNKDLTWGNKDFDDTVYSDYIKELKERKNKFIVATPKDFNNKLTATKIKQFIIQHKLDVVAIDGISYLEDERYIQRFYPGIFFQQLHGQFLLLKKELQLPGLHQNQTSC